MDGKDTRSLNLWLGIAADGMGILTAQKPKIAEVDETGIRDLYIPYGDGVGLRHLCGRMVGIALGLARLPRRKVARITLTMKLAGDWEDPDPAGANDGRND